MKPVSISFSLLFVVASLVGCGSGAEKEGDGLPSCPTAGTKLTYDSFGKPFMDKYCQSCHASTSKDRQGAPAKINFDTASEISSLASEIYDQAGGTNTIMPPSSYGSKPTSAERAQLAEWLSCGAP